MMSRLFHFSLTMVLMLIKVSRRENGSAATPLDAFNLRFTVFKNYSKSAVDLINGFGAKCLGLLYKRKTALTI